MLQRLPLLLGLVLCGMTHASTQPQIELTATPAWKGWSRPGRSSEVDVRLSASAATTATLLVVSGRSSVRTQLDLQPGRIMRVHIPVSAAERVEITAGAPAAAPQRQTLDIAQSESPLLGVALATDEPARLEGFHTVAFSADDLPRNASAYASIDALILDATTLGALDRRQLGALLGYIASCGRTVVLHINPQVQRLLDGAGGCGNKALMSAASSADALHKLQASLAANLPRPLALGNLGELVQPDLRAWQRVALSLAVYFAAAALLLMFSTHLPVLLAMPALFAVAVLALLHATHLPTQLIVWSEASSGAQLARYQAWQAVPGMFRERRHMQMPARFAAGAQPCDAGLPMRFDSDAASGQLKSAEFETRLFHQAWLCYSGTFPTNRAIAIETRDDGSGELRNAGTSWPPGTLLAAGAVRELPALDAGARIDLPAVAAQRPDNAALRTAMMRTRSQGVAALWDLDLAGAEDMPVDSRGWLLMTTAAP